MSCSQSFEIPADELSFLKKMDFRFGDAVISLIEPIHCPDCANQIRTAHRNERNLYERSSNFSKQRMISIYAPDPPWGEPYKVYTYDEYHSDQWDSLQYGKDYDFSRSFFEQFAELQKAVPRLGLIAIGNENSPYTTGTGYCKNCYLINSSENCSDCYYGKLLQGCKDCVDCTYIYDSELCYECFSVYNSYHCVHVSYSSNCSDCWFSENLTGCRNCFLCTNLTNKEYHFMNQPLDKVEYERRVKEFVGSHRNFEKAKEILQRLRKERIHKYANVVNCENCTGDFLKNSQNCLNCYDVNDSQDCRNVWVGVNIKDTYECSNMYLKQELNYQVLGTIETYHVAFSLYVFHSQNILYSDHIFHSKDLFACEGMKKQRFCILNKQYSENDYNALVPKIIEHMKSTGEWGKFFPVNRAPHGYNETLAYEYYPLNKEEVLKNGWNWYEEKGQKKERKSSYEIPDHIDQVKEDITDQVLICEMSKKPYKIIVQELAFYRKLKLPIPHRAPDQRHLDHMQLRNPRHLWERKCSKCSASMQSTFSPDRIEKVYCEKCYLDEVY